MNLTIYLKTIGRNVDRAFVDHITEVGFEFGRIDLRGS
jgi:hypothetical protein